MKIVYFFIFTVICMLHKDGHKISVQFFIIYVVDLKSALISQTLVEHYAYGALEGMVVVGYLFGF